MRTLKKLILGAVAFVPLLTYGSQAWAEGLDNQVPSCYAANHVQPSGPVYNKLLVVLVDQTVLLDANLQQQVLDSIHNLVQPGTRYVVGEFSAFSQGRYLNILASGIAEAMPTDDQLNNMPINAVRPFKKCMSDQLAYAQLSAEKTAYVAMKGASSSLDQSDILMTMKDISALMDQSKASDKILLAVTDGLEYSSVTSFYAHDTARDINPDVEMKKVNADNLTGNFGGARVYVIGGADEPPATSGTQAERNGYRNPQMQMHLKAFWQDYFTASNAQLIEFGEPSLLMLPQW